MTTARFLQNPRANRADPWEATPRLLTREGAAAAAAEIQAWSDYAATPLRSLPGLARAAGIAGIWYKDEANRFGVGSFKALGGAYGVQRVLQRTLHEHHGVEASVEELVEGRYRELTQALVVTCATDGNHGRAVAWGARRFGCRAVIYLPQHAHPERAAAIAALGAEVVMVDGSYDDAVDRAIRDAESVNRLTNGPGAADPRRDRLLVADTGDPDTAPVALDVMHGYTVITREVLDQLSAGELPTHVFVQAGVGGLAAAVIAPLWWRFGPDRPVTVVVEPTRAACLMAAAEAGRPHRIAGDIDSFMACLSAGEASGAAWPVVGEGADAFLAIPDEGARDAMRAMIRGDFGDERVQVGESGVAGVAGLLALAEKAAWRGAVGLGPDARVLVIGTEGPNVEAVRREIAG